MSTMRFTVVDSSNTTTFLAPPHALKAFAAACSHHVETTAELLSELGRYDGSLSRNLRDQLDVFKEHNVAGETDWINQKLAVDANHGAPVVVLDEATHALSQRPGTFGMIVINLTAKRIVQIQNTYANLERSDRGRLRRNGLPVRALYHYTLPDEWSIVP